MDLRTYLEQADRGAAAALARAVGVHPVMVSQWASGLKAVPVERCMAIERATAGQVTRQDLRPDDYWLIWPDLPAPELAEARAA
ncbi:helix-turn-helix domain-containing protein [Pelomonas sp. V22]|uniref:transcriptional regulator n=1 Tax=Pelomonas sp. V22 TaxID=2822139 RepID=UPI0024A8A138|nr:Cro/CI family transcriptional regulator [Pelomonas sp. V22]MDI4633319.1 helix-turn-helix domain-containing protein [Pelomonas sp. V22]